MRKQKHDAMVMLLFLRKAHSRRIPQKQSTMIFNKRKRKLRWATAKERTNLFVLHTQTMYYLRNTHSSQKSPLQNDKYFTALFRSPKSQYQHSFADLYKLYTLVRKTADLRTNSISSYSNSSNQSFKQFLCVRLYKRTQRTTRTACSVF